MATNQGMHTALDPNIIRFPIRRPSNDTSLSLSSTHQKQYGLTLILLATCTANTTLISRQLLRVQIQKKRVWRRAMWIQIRNK